MGGWSLRKASYKLCRMKKKSRDQAPGKQKSLETDVKHTTLTTTFFSFPATVCHS